jgi:hypothetical protein
MYEDTNSHRKQLDYYSWHRDTRQSLRLRTELHFQLTNHTTVKVKVSYVRKTLYK